MNAKFNFIIPDDLIKRVKTLAKAQGTTPSAVFNRFAREFVDGEDKLMQLEKRVSELEKTVAEIQEKTGK